MHYSAQLADTIRSGEVAVMRTDTIYGIVASARSRAAVERVYEIKQRTPNKSPIVLIGSLSQLFDTYDEATMSALAQYWPGPNSIILPSSNGPTWITRGNGSIAYRLPASNELRALLRESGPIIAPSANPEGQPPAETIEEARKYFDELVPHYEDGGRVEQTAPSSLYQFTGGVFTQLR